MPQWLIILSSYRFNATVIDCLKLPQFDMPQWWILSYYHKCYAKVIDCSQTSIPDETWELTLLSHGNKKKKKKFSLIGVVLKYFL